MIFLPVFVMFWIHFIYAVSPCLLGSRDTFYLCYLSMPPWCFEIHFITDTTPCLLRAWDTFYLCYLSMPPWCSGYILSMLFLHDVVLDLSASFLSAVTSSTGELSSLYRGTHCFSFYYLTKEHSLTVSYGATRCFHFSVPDNDY